MIVKLWEKVELRDLIVGWLGVFRLARCPSYWSKNAFLSSSLADCWCHRSDRNRNTFYFWVGSASFCDQSLPVVTKYDSVGAEMSAISRNDWGPGDTL